MLIHPGEIYIRIIKLDLCNAIAQTDTAHLCYLINHILHCSGKTLKMCQCGSSASSYSQHSLGQPASLLWKNPMSIFFLIVLLLLIPPLDYGNGQLCLPTILCSSQKWKSSWQITALTSKRQKAFLFLACDQNFCSIPL